jgi:hypothetical protein
MRLVDLSIAVEFAIYTTNGPPGDPGASELLSQPEYRHGWGKIRQLLGGKSVIASYKSRQNEPSFEVDIGQP